MRQATVLGATLRAGVHGKRSRYQTILTKQQDMRVLHRQLREDDAIPQAVRQLTNRCRLMRARETEPAELLPPCLSQRSANRLITNDCIASESREWRGPSVEVDKVRHRLLAILREAVDESDLP